MKNSTARCDKNSWLDFAPAIALLAISTGGIFVATLNPSGDQDQYAVVAPVWNNLAQTAGLVAAAGGDIVDVGGLTNIVIVHSKNPNIVRALYHAGAWLVIDPVLVRGCLGLKHDPALPLASGAI